MRAVLQPHLSSDTLDVVPVLESFTQRFTAKLQAHACEKDVVAFKSIVCYRTGLDIATWSSSAGIKFALLDIFKMLKDKGTIRLEQKPLNDLVVRIALDVAGEYDRPGE